MISKKEEVQSDDDDYSNISEKNSDDEYERNSNTEEFDEYKLDGYHPVTIGENFKSNTYQAIILFKKDIK